MTTPSLLFATFVWLVVLALLGGLIFWGMTSQYDINPVVSGITAVAVGVFMTRWLIGALWAWTGHHDESVWGRVLGLNLPAAK